MILLCIFFVFTSVTSTAQLPSNLINGLLAYYPFCGNANDVSGNNNNGTVSGAVLVPDRFGNANSAYSFDGTTSYISGVVPDFPLQNTPRTISQWFYTTSAPSANFSETIFSWGDNLQSEDEVFGSILWNTNVTPLSIGSWVGDHTGGNDAVIPYNYSLNTWYHLVVVYNNSTDSIYINGTYLGSKTTTGLITAADLFIIGRAIEKNSYFKGTIDDIGVWNRALNSTEISQVYNLGDICFALPVHLQSFTAVQNKGDADLQWKTVTEVNNNHFEIERSSNGTSFTSIGTVSGNNNTATVHDYSFADNHTLAGINYYRLKQVDNDGNYFYSKTLSLKFNSQAEAFMLIPNPAYEMVKFQFPSSNGVSVINVYDMNGRKIIEKEVSADSYSQNIDVSKLSAGVYNVELIQNEIHQSIKLIKQ
jgi:hypothetical protein